MFIMKEEPRVEEMLCRGQDDKHENTQGKSLTLEKQRRARGQNKAMAAQKIYMN